MATPESNLDKIYTEASQWVRMANTVIWSAGNFLIPASLAPFVALFTSVPHSFAHEHPKILWLISVGISIVWVLITCIFYKTTAKARETLIEIENIWLNPEKPAKNSKLLFYENQANILGFDLNKESKSLEKIKISNYLKNPIFQMQIIYIVALSVVWIIVLSLL